MSLLLKSRIYAIISTCFKNISLKVKEFSEDHKELFEAKTKQNAVNELKELYYNSQDVDKRIQYNIRRIKELLDKKPQLSQAFAKDTNQSFLDMFTNYEITVARYSKFLHEFCSLFQRLIESSRAQITRRFLGEK